MRRNLKPPWSVCDRPRSIYSNGRALCRNLLHRVCGRGRGLQQSQFGQMERRRDDRVATFRPQQPEPPGSAEQGLYAGTAEGRLDRHQGDSERGFLIPLSAKMTPEQASALSPKRSLRPDHPDDRTDRVSIDPQPRSSASRVGRGSTGKQNRDVAQRRRLPCGACLVSGRSSSARLVRWPEEAGVINTVQLGVEVTLTPPLGLVGVQRDTCQLDVGPALSLRRRAWPTRRTPPTTRRRRP
jgi:hypothetical protein